MRILVVEDDLVIASGLERVLRKNGYHPDVAHDGETGLRLAFENNYALFVFDVMLPKMDGFELCRTVRRAKIDTPVLMLTARDTVEDKVEGLDTGADDYLVKPFSTQELLARLRALSRRQNALKSETVQIADLVLDGRTHTATRAGKDLKLTKREFTLLEALARNAGQILSRDVILERVWNNEEALPNTVNFHLSSLRKKLDADHPTKLIHTVHGFGYTLKPPTPEP